MHELQYIIAEITYTTDHLPLVEDPASEGSQESEPGRLFQHCNACNTESLTGFTYEK